MAGILHCSFNFLLHEQSCWAAKPPASSMAPYPSFSPKGKKLGHCASPPFPTEPAVPAGLRRGPR